MSQLATCPRCGGSVDFVAVYRRPALVNFGYPLHPSVHGGDDKPAPSNMRWTLECTSGHTWRRAVEFEREWVAAGAPALP